MSEQQQFVPQSNTMGILAIVFAILGIFFLGIIFVPLALLFSIIAFYQASKKRASWVIPIIAVILTVIAFWTSPTLWAIFGISTLASM